MAEKQTDIAGREETRVARRESIASPFRMLERFAEEMYRLFDDFGLGRGWLPPRVGYEGLRSPSRHLEAWFPDIEMVQRNNDLVIRADLPGLAKDDVKVDITEDAVTIQGERRQEHKKEAAGVYRSERSYGSFCRVIALPEGAMTDQAKATFKDGVLEIAMPAPPETVTRGRRLEILESSTQKK